MDRLFVMIGAITMLIGVAAGAFGAHGLASYFETYPRYASTFDTAVRYQLIHGLAFFAIAWAATQWETALINWAGWLLVAGVVLFSGSLYLLVFTRVSILGAITPIGGVAFLAGWFCLLLAAWRG